MGLSLGTIILPPSPSFFRKQQRILFEGGDPRRLTKLGPSAPRQNAKTTIELFSYTVVWWTLLALIRQGLQVSRRMVGLPVSQCAMQDYSHLSSIQANLSYILWIVAFNTSFILAFYLIDMVFFPTRVSKLKDPSDPSGKRILQEDPTTSTPKSAPALLEALNRNGLVIFLVVSLYLDQTSLFVSEHDHPGECCDGLDQPFDANNVHTKRASNGHIDWLLLWYMFVCVDIPQ